MPPLAASEMSLRDYPTGFGAVTFNVDPVTYRPFENARRGSSHPVLDGSVVHQDFGLKEADWVISMEVEVTDYVTLQSFWEKYRVTGGEFELRDWFPNRFRVIFEPGAPAFNPVPIRGSCESFEVQVRFRVLEVLEFFGNPY